MSLQSYCSQNFNVMADAFQQQFNVPVDFDSLP